MIELILSAIAGFVAALLSSNGGNNFPPPLDRAEEEMYFRKAKLEGDAGAREKLIEHNLRLVAHIVRKYYASHPSEEDLLSIGTIGLIKSVDSYNFENGARFATYAAKCIQNEILMYFRAQKKTLQEISLNETIDTDRDGNALTYEDIIKVDDTIADDIDAKMKIKKASEFIMKNLTDREREIIILRYGLTGGRPITQREVARKLGISRSYVSRIEKSALERIKSAL